MDLIAGQPSLQQSRQGKLYPKHRPIDQRCLRLSEGEGERLSELHRAFRPVSSIVYEGETGMWLASGHRIP